MIDISDITGVILAGGRGSRMGGADKGLQNFNSVPLALHTQLRLSAQVGELLINANRNLAAYESFGVPVWPDAASLGDFAGPLAGFLTGLERAETAFVVTVPCDTPWFPTDLAERMAQALGGSDQAIAMASGLETDPDGQSQLRTQPVFCLLPVSLLESLVRFTHGGGRKIDQWTAQHPTVAVPFNQAHDDPRAFANANTLAELQRLAS